MSWESRLKKLEKHILKSAGYVQGMKILEEIKLANELDNREAIPHLLIKLYEIGNKTA